MLVLNPFGPEYLKKAVMMMVMQQILDFIFWCQSKRSLYGVMPIKQSLIAFL
jgi:hypothetical protein